MIKKVKTTKAIRPQTSGFFYCPKAMNECKPLSLSSVNFTVMKKLIVLLLTLSAFSACSNQEDKKEELTSENEVDAARNFIRAALDGKWNQAKNLMIQDSTNLQLLQAAEDNWNHTNIADKRGYENASITMYDTRTIGDSAVIVQYANSYYPNKKDSLRLMRINNEWLVDLKFTLLKTDTANDAR
jgi:hypothetical protein